MGNFQCKLNYTSNILLQHFPDDKSHNSILILCWLCCSVYPFTKPSSSGVLATYMFVIKTAAVMVLVISGLFVMFTLSRYKQEALKDFWFLVDLFSIFIGLATTIMFL